ncbi:putative 4-hydroxy-tetrahydrodipicolinate reductase 3 [Hibiscus syriacus]|uniref:4-hydroxy-tetrahydrodipicolinate reductase 3 n=1 Tax=Hibiscus syriacus TaxID=106335 RepID=A0A6A2XRF9_HIBSY|nr:protein COFACTOR ASSEMBLY OF COMPLEX C SUBUNIT B CCB2, chloroplastic isoform X2 [Hibiscus syriacus]XP_039029090.1 protein COFACTOR ASSEMBLY OF COMPLEX C SUBUNIT B CCB2, chloroplastic isoform X2 [Hibiscus syriacus]KAE8678303.1 putative 4-hydroxy-tetrahydrodipicolinate reductase 3 [Hibiscus syriacus]
MILPTTKTLLINPLIQLKTPLPLKFRPKFASISARLDNSEQQLNLSVLRFTLGIPGLDESYLPRWLGYGFGSLLILNHLLGSDSVTAAQLRTEALGISLAAFSVTLPYLGKFLKGATPMDQTTLPEGAEQIFVMSQNVSGAQKEGLAWATYVLLRNTSSTSVLILAQGALCIRGYWNLPDGVSKDNVLDWVKSNIEETGLSELTDTLYFPQSSDAEFQNILPQGTRSVLVQPILDPNPSTNDMGNIEGFVLLASSMRYAYSEKDRAWIRAVSNKLRSKN